MQDSRPSFNLPMMRSLLKGWMELLQAGTLLRKNCLVTPKMK